MTISQNDHDQRINRALNILEDEDSTVYEWQVAVRNINEAKGWFDSDRTFGDDMALLHSEVSEAFEAFRKHGTEDVTLSDGNSGGFTPKPEGVGSELADVLVRILHPQA